MFLRSARGDTDVSLFSPADPIIVSEDAKGRFILAFLNNKIIKKSFFSEREIRFIGKKTSGLGIDIFFN